MRYFLIVVLTMATACAPRGPEIEYPSLLFLDKKTPSQFTPEEQAIFEAMPTQGFKGYCWNVVRMSASYSAADRGGVKPILKKRGMSSRDIEIILDPSTAYATGMTFRGFTCKLGYEPEVNKAFYSGAGHQWQVVLPGYSYVYLEGDGTEGGMRITSWN